MKYCYYSWNDWSEKSSCECYEIMYYSFDENTGTIRIKKDPNDGDASYDIYENLELTGNKIYRNGIKTNPFSKVSTYRYIKCD